MNGVLFIFDKMQDDPQFDGSQRQFQLDLIILTFWVVICVMFWAAMLWYLPQQNVFWPLVTFVFVWSVGCRSWCFDFSINAAYFNKAYICLVVWALRVFIIYILKIISNKLIKSKGNKNKNKRLLGGGGVARCI